MSTKFTLAEAKERLDRLDMLIGDPPSEDPQPIFLRCDMQEERMDDLQRIHNGHLLDLDERFGRQRAEETAAQACLTDRVTALEGEMALLKRALLSQRAPDEIQASKVRVPEPKPFQGVRDAKELGNFIWDVEQYLRATHIPLEEQVSLVSMYLAGDAKLWWRTKVMDDQCMGRQSAATWEAMKAELREQFLPSNTSWSARARLRRLWQTGTVREYVKEFSSLMLDIRDMSEEDRLFNFIAGLQTWAQVELRRQGVKDLPTAVAVAEGLVDLRDSASTSGADKGVGGTRQKPTEGRKPRPDRGAEQVAGQDPNLAGPMQCFVCKGPHRARDCPRKQKPLGTISTLEVAEDDVDDPVLAQLSSLRVVGGTTAGGSAKAKSTRTSTSSIGGECHDPGDNA